MNYYNHYSSLNKDETHQFNFPLETNHNVYDVKFLAKVNYD